MTVSFRQHVECPNCGHRLADETEFVRWMRTREDLDSWKDGIVRADCDHIIHRYKFPQSGRNVQAIMVVEVKTRVDFTRSELVRISEADTLHLVNQILFRNRRENMHSKPKHQTVSNGRMALSLRSRKMVTVRCYGVHALYFSGTSPKDSTRIEWDHHDITEDVLVRLLRFDLDPDTLLPIDLRIHQKAPKASLFDSGCFLPEKGAQDEHDR